VAISAPELVRRTLLWGKCCCTTHKVMQLLDNFPKILHNTITSWWNTTQSFKKMHIDTQLQYLSGWTRCITTIRTTTKPTIIMIMMMMMVVTTMTYSFSLNIR
jgi:hypothetical protein